MLDDQAETLFAAGVADMKNNAVASTAMLIANRQDGLWLDEVFDCLE